MVKTKLSRNVYPPQRTALLYNNFFYRQVPLGYQFSVRSIEVIWRIEQTWKKWEKKKFSKLDLFDLKIFAKKHLN